MSELARVRPWLPSDDEEGEVFEFLSFDVADESYAFPLSAVHEILKPPPLTPVPRAPKHILGVISVRGTIVTIFDPHEILGLGAVDASSIGRILMVDNGVERIGVAVNRVLQVERLTRADIEHADPGDSEFARHVVGVGRLMGADGERMLILLDPRSLLGDR